MHIIDKRIKDLEPNGQIEYAKGSFHYIDFKRSFRFDISKQEKVG